MRRTKAEYDHEFYLRHRVPILQRVKEYYMDNREQRLQYARNYYLEHQEQALKYAREHGKARHAVLKYTIFTHYSNGEPRCAHCGFKDIRALSIDHINGGGTAHRRSLGSSEKFYYWLKKNNFPDGFQVLCMNCQWIKRHNNSEFGNFA